MTVNPMVEGKFNQLWRIGINGSIPKGRTLASYDVVMMSELFRRGIVLGDLDSVNLSVLGNVLVGLATLIRSKSNTLRYDTEKAWRLSIGWIRVKRTRHSEAEVEQGPESKRRDSRDPIVRDIDQLAVPDHGLPAEELTVPSRIESASVQPGFGIVMQRDDKGQGEDDTDIDLPSGRGLNSSFEGLDLSDLIMPEIPEAADRKSLNPGPKIAGYIEPNAAEEQDSGLTGGEACNAIEREVPELQQLIETHSETARENPDPAFFIRAAPTLSSDGPLEAPPLELVLYQRAGATQSAPQSSSEDEENVVSDFVVESTDNDEEYSTDDDENPPIAEIDAVTTLDIREYEERAANILSIAPHLLPQNKPRPRDPNIKDGILRSGLEISPETAKLFLVHETIDPGEQDGSRQEETRGKSVTLGPQRASQADGHFTSPTPQPALDLVLYRPADVTTRWAMNASLPSSDLSIDIQLRGEDEALLAEELLDEENAATGAAFQGAASAGAVTTIKPRPLITDLPSLEYSDLDSEPPKESVEPETPDMVLLAAKIKSEIADNKTHNFDELHSRLYHQLKSARQMQLTVGDFMYTLLGLAGGGDLEMTQDWPDSGIEGEISIKKL